MPGLNSAQTAASARILDVQQLTVHFTTSERTVEAVRNLSLHVDRGETLAIVGESGSGKSVSALAIMRLVEHGGGRIVGGQMQFHRRDGQVLDLAQATQSTMRELRGADLAMIFQEPMTSLNPVFTVGEQIAESIRLHQGKDGAEARAEALRMLELVRIPEARRVLDRYPASALRRHAAAGDDRHGALLPAVSADRRRAHDGAGRHHPGADSATHPRTAARDAAWA